MFRCCPYQSLIVSLRSPHVVALGGFKLVAILGIHTSHTCVVFSNLVAKSPKVVIKRRRERFARTTVVALFLEQSSNFLQCLRIFCQFFVRQ
jgi:hypothetical protein